MSPGRLIVLVYIRFSRWLLLLHFQVHFEHQQYRPYTVYTTEGLNTVLRTINLSVDHSFQKEKEEKLNVTGYFACSLARKAGGIIPPDLDVGDQSPCPSQLRRPC